MYYIHLLLICWVFWVFYLLWGFYVCGGGFFGCFGGVLDLGLCVCVVVAAVTAAV